MLFHEKRKDYIMYNGECSSITHFTPGFINKAGLINCPSRKYSSIVRPGLIIWLVISVCPRTATAPGHELGVSSRDENEETSAILSY